MCTKSGKLAKRLVGIWNIDMYTETKNGKTQSTPNVGSIEFKDDGTGIWTTVSTSTFGGMTNTTTYTMTFYWQNTGASLSTIISGGTDYYVITTNESNKQVWEQSSSTTSQTNGGTMTTTTSTDKYELSKK